MSETLHAEKPEKGKKNTLPIVSGVISFLGFLILTFDPRQSATFGTAMFLFTMAICFTISTAAEAIIEAIEKKAR